MTWVTANTQLQSENQWKKATNVCLVSQDFWNIKRNTDMHEFSPYFVEEKYFVPPWLLQILSSCNSNRWSFCKYRFCHLTYYPLLSRNLLKLCFQTALPMRKYFKKFEYNVSKGLSLAVESIKHGELCEWKRNKCLPVTIQGCFSINSCVSMAYPMAA